MDSQALEVAGAPSVLFLPIASQGPEPEQADPAVPDLAAGSAAAHLQHAQVSPDRQGDADRCPGGLAGPRRAGRAGAGLREGAELHGKPSCCGLGNGKASTHCLFVFCRVFYICGFLKKLYIKSMCLCFRL